MDENKISRKAPVTPEEKLLRNASVPVVPVMKGKYLITTDNWFIAPDGTDYKAVWGEVEVIGDEVLGVKTNARSTNWYAKIGSEENHVIVAGCQIHYAARCENKPDLDGGSHWEYDAGTKTAQTFCTPNKIYIAE